MVWCKDSAEMLAVAHDLSGNLTATLHAGTAEVAAQGALLDILANKAGRVILNGFPTGLEVSSAIVHSGPYPATSDGGRSTLSRHTGPHPLGAARLLSEFYRGIAAARVAKCESPGPASVGQQRVDKRRNLRLLFS